MKALPIVAGLALLTSWSAGASVASSDQAYASYVILGQDGAGDNVAIARTVIDTKQTCPTISSKQSKTPIAMVTRDNPNHFSVVVCEALVEFDQQYQLNFADKPVALPKAKSAIKHVQVFGDTGCKTQTEPGGSGCAIGSPAEPFKSLADDGAKHKVDLVLHMGDYNYRGTSGKTSFTQKVSGKLVQDVQWPYDAGDGLSQADRCGQESTPYYAQAANNSNNPDIWRNWHDDLFRSAKTLMAKAPWIATRGNHELCSRAGAGYFYFLDAGSNLLSGKPQLSCPAPQVDKLPLDNTLQIPSYKVSFDQLDVVVIDSANACDAYADTPYEGIYKQVFADVNRLVDSQSWLVTHRPIWGVESYDPSKSTLCDASGKGPQLSCINQMMQQAIKQQPSKMLPEQLSLIWTGHMHQFQSVSFGDARPANIVVGSSGVELSQSLPFGAYQTAVDDLPAQVLSTADQFSYQGKNQASFGYMRVKVDKKGNWKSQLVNPQLGIALAECSSKQDKTNGVCQLGKGIAAPSSN